MRALLPIIASALLALDAGCTTADDAQFATQRPRPHRTGQIGVGEPIGLVGGAVEQQSR